MTSDTDNIFFNNIIALYQTDLESELDLETIFLITSLQGMSMLFDFKGLTSEKEQEINKLYNEYKNKYSHAKKLTTFSEEALQKLSCSIAGRKFLAEFIGGII